MAKDIDVYQLVRAFANKNHLTSIDYVVFSRAIQRQAVQSDQSEHLYRDLAINPDSVLVPRLYRLAQDKRLALETIGGELATIVLPEHYGDAFFREYKRMEDSPELPFPDEEGMKISVPPEWIQAISLEADLAHISDREGEPSVPLFRLVFSGVVKPIVVPQSFVPEKLLELAVLKLRHYLRQGANREFILNKLLYAFPNKENQLKDAFGAVQTKPFEAIESMKTSSSDIIFPFWAYLTSHVKRDLEKKPDKTPEDLSIYQAALLCEFYAGYYKGKIKRLLDIEAACKALDQGLRKAPYNFGLDDLTAFRDSQGQPLLGRLSREDIEDWLRDKTTKSLEGSLPDLLVVATGQGRRVYIAKERLFPLVFRLLSEARADLRSRLVSQWSRLLEDFKSSAAMDDDEAFRRELSSVIETRFPLLDAIMKDRLCPLVFDELASRNLASPDIARLFYKGELIPIDELLDLDRKALHTDARMILPFWYSIPILSGLVRLFRRLSRSPSPAPRPAPPQPKPKANEGQATEGQTLKERRAAFSRAAAAIEAELLPSGYSTDEYLRELEERWNNLLNPKSKSDLREDVNALVRDYLRSILRSLSPSGLTADRVKNLAATLADTPNLLKIKNHAALELYIQLYMLKVIGKG
jgi:hypothetical protein